MSEQNTIHPDNIAPSAPIALPPAQMREDIVLEMVVVVLFLAVIYLILVAVLATWLIHGHSWVAAG